MRQLAEFYECNAKQICQNFNNNIERFAEGKHYFKLEGDELNTFRNCVENFDTVVSPRTSVLYLWTKRGAARHAKMLNTEKAWEVFEALEDNYFDRPAVVDNQFISNSEESKKFAKAKLLRELALATGENQLMRNKLIRHAAKLLLDDDWIEEYY